MPAVAGAMASHAGWPQISGELLMNKLDQSRPLDGRVGFDPFDGTDTSYSCDGLPGGSTACAAFAVTRDGRRSTCGALAQVTSIVSLPPLADGLALCAGTDAGALPRDGTLVAAGLARAGHNELLGAHGDDTIHAGPYGDVIWGDYKPSGQPRRQVDHLYGGPGNDFIYASHGTNYISTGGGVDVVHAHFGGGRIACQSGTVTVYLSHASARRYRLRGCRQRRFT
jgi:hypothetical protein